MRGTFLCFAKEKYPKERRPPVCDPCASLRGKPAAGRLRGAPWNSLRCVAASFRQPRRVSSRGMDASTPMLTPQPPRRRRSQQGWDRRTAKHPDIHSCHRCARPRLRSAWRLRPRERPSEAKARADVLLPVPLWMRRGAQGLADQGSRLSERSETERVRARPRQTRAPQVAPERSAGDADSGVALSLVPFFRRRERKGLACRATPGLRPQQRHAAQSAHATKHYKINSYQRISH
ncbi:hypothetical protein CLU85_1379 [Acidovorax sp. 69]|nr:hypothetical protein CLU85_1379 [Acidovorax sp. 69]